MNSYKSDFDNPSSKIEILHLSNELFNDNLIGPNEGNVQLYDQTCSQFYDILIRNNAKEIRNSLKIIRNSVRSLKKASLHKLVQYNIFEMLSRLLDHPSNKIRVSTALAILILIKNANAIQYFFQIVDFSELLFKYISTCTKSIDGVFYGLYVLYHFFDNYYQTNPNLFFPQLSFQYLDSIYQQIKGFPDDVSYKKKIDIYQYIIFFYKKLCKQKIDKDDYEIIASFIIDIFSSDFTFLYTDLFKIISNLIKNKNMPIEEFFNNNLHRYVISEIISTNSLSNISAYDLLSIVFEHGLQVKDLIRLSVNENTISHDLQFEPNFDPENDRQIFFNKFMEYTLDSIEVQMQIPTISEKAENEYEYEYEEEQNEEIERFEQEKIERFNDEKIEFNDEKIERFNDEIIERFNDEKNERFNEKIEFNDEKIEGFNEKIKFNDEKIERFNDEKNDEISIEFRMLISASATRMLTSAIRNDDDMNVINYLISDQGSSFGFLPIVNNLCASSIFSLIQASAECLMEILSRISQTQFLEMNRIIFVVRTTNENSKIMHCSLVSALITIATTDNEKMVIDSLNFLVNLATMSEATDVMNWMINEYLSADGCDKLKEIEDQNDNQDITILCKKIRKMFSPINT